MAEIFFFNFTANWYVLLGFGLLIVLLTSHVRKSYKGALKFGFIGLAICVAIELIGVGLNLWTYTGGNWPVILWVSYFVFSVAWYQLVKALEKMKVL